ncbi:hypothetical protein [Paenibacillus sp. Marseille-Q4541]|uniref:hypothetical protein n=1 Tax=Paenibacillus sp. Marseille-Q4541 TaxID=2831522 RepID=UPI001BAE4228|nr:hypothetical protein [Paenibacillus sp. Marseille-Q4541]
MKKVDFIKRLLFVVLCLFLLISYQIPILEKSAVGSHSNMMNESTMEPMDLPGDSHPKAMIRESVPSHKMSAVHPLQLLFTILSIFMIFRVPIIEPPFKVFYDNIKRRLYLMPIKFTSMFVAA